MSRELAQRSLSRVLRDREIERNLLTDTCLEKLAEATCAEPARGTCFAHYMLCFRPRSSVVCWGTKRKTKEDPETRGLPSRPVFRWVSFSFWEGGGVGSDAHDRKPTAQALGMLGALGHGAGQPLLLGLWANSEEGLS